MKKNIEQPNEIPEQPKSANTSAPNWYDRWHSTDHHHLVHWGLFLVIIAAAWALLSTRIGDWVYSFNDPGVVVRIAKPNTQLVLDPQSANVTEGDVIEANIILDTGSERIDGVDIYSLHYDPSLLKVIDDVATQPGVQIKPGSVLGLNAANIVDATSGTIKFGQVAAGGSSYQGRGVLATIHFKAVSPGVAYLKFDFKVGNTIDSNAAYKGKDRLAKVVDAIYTIEKK